MRLADLCKEIEYTLLQGSLETDAADLIYDSRKVAPGTAFICMVGAVTDGHQYIPDAVQKGASVIVLERAEEAAQIPEEVTVLQVASARYALALMSAAYFGYPDRKLTTVGLTGTKGKTTTTYIIQDVMKRAGRKTGLIGTIAIVIGEKSIPAKNTTPESYEIHKYMAQMVEAGCEYMIMEVSSQGLKLDRTAGIVFDYGVFTNLSPDHIGPTEHADFEEYLACKNMLFRQCRRGIFNIDDPHAEQMMAGHTCEVITMSSEKQADYMASRMTFIKESGMLGMKFIVSGKMSSAVKIHIPGRFSVYNALTTIAICHELGVKESAILMGLQEVQVKGRVELLSVSKRFSVIIDFAHNGFSARSVIDTLKEYAPNHIICVFGCGGNRSRERRFGMGEVMGEMADLSILTTDNPRFEKLEDINADIKKGLAKYDGAYIEIADRKEAIAYAITHAQPGDMIIMLGKGHEDYIEIEGVKHHFSEHEAIAEIIAEIKAGERKMEYCPL